MGRRRRENKSDCEREEERQIGNIQYEIREGSEGDEEREGRIKVSVKEEGR